VIRDLYTSLTAREQRAIRWSAAATVAALWLSTAWADPRFLLAIPLSVGGFYAYRRWWHPEQADDPDDLDLL
jgi:hypothetical protein